MSSQESVEELVSGVRRDVGGVADRLDAMRDLRDVADDSGAKKEFQSLRRSVDLRQSEDKLREVKRHVDGWSGEHRNAGLRAVDEALQALVDIGETYPRLTIGRDDRFEDVVRGVQRVEEQLDVYEDVARETANRDIVAGVRPSRYHTQAGYEGFCSGYAVHSVLSAYGLADAEEDPWEYDPMNQDLEGLSLVDRLCTGLDVTTPKLVSQVLEKHGVDAPVRQAAGEDGQQRLKAVKDHVRGGDPVLLLIGQRYDAEGSYSPGFKEYAAHYLTLWGYNDFQRDLYVHDSFLEGYAYDATVPVGTARRDYDTFVEDWRGTLYTRPTMSYTYFPLHAK